MRARKRDRQREATRAEFHEAAELLPAADDPELEYLRTQYVSEFKRALGDAFDLLPMRERNLLRQHYLDGLTIEAVARLHRVHRATAARWLADAREVVLVNVRKQMRLRCSLSDVELESLVSAVRDRFDLSISRVLRRISPENIGTA
jgi:RNA polymerase sigma-70 factor (ECF subfamily)